MFSRFRSFFILALTAGLLAGCATSTSSLSRIDANRRLYESWPLDVQQAVLDQRVIEGMDEEMVQMALGRPTEITSRPNPRTGAFEEVWIYRKGGGGGGGLRSTGVSVGAGTGGVYVGGSPVVMGGGGGSTYVEEDHVVFVNGKVIRTASIP